MSMPPDQDHANKCSSYPTQRNTCYDLKIKRLPCAPFDVNTKYTGSKSVPSGTGCLLTDFEYAHNINSTLCNRTFQFGSAFHPVLYPEMVDLERNMSVQDDRCFVKKHK
jgi:hypothetical protein